MSDKCEVHGCNNVQNISEQKKESSFTLSFYRCKN